MNHNDCSAFIFWWCEKSRAKLTLPFSHVVCRCYLSLPVAIWWCNERAGHHPTTALIYLHKKKHLNILTVRPLQEHGYSCCSDSVHFFLFNMIIYQCVPQMMSMLQDPVSNIYCNATAVKCIFFSRFVDDSRFLESILSLWHSSFFRPGKSLKRLKLYTKYYSSLYSFLTSSFFSCLFSSFTLVYPYKNAYKNTPSNQAFRACINTNLVLNNSRIYPRRSIQQAPYSLWTGLLE